ncbi:hypothetical protein AAG570_011298 [Ranatra chinensis]|uniref:Uncharacterized protein n=1 Tax=Ranatra chinensis TaxID=642074 RepID=A0ABD0YKA0_9HEMI
MHANPIIFRICSTGLLASDAGQKDVENVTISGTNGTANEVKHSVGNPSGSGGAMEGEELEEIKRLQKERRPRRCHTRSASLGEKAGVGSDNLRRPTIIADPSLLKDLKKFDTSLLSYPSKCLYRTPEEYKDIYPLPQRSYQLKP